MSFWKTSDGAAVKANSEYDAGGGDITPIPSGENVLAAIDEAGWAERNGSKYISLRWSVLEPQAYKNRKVFQKLWVTDQDPNAKSDEAGKKKSDNARAMLAAIDANCGGELYASETAPSDIDLQSALMSKPMTVKVKVYDMVTQEGGTMTGNWIAAVGPAAGFNSRPATQPTSQSQAQVKKPLADDDVPF
jgi:hypothetical protein